MRRLVILVIALTVTVTTDVAAAPAAPLAPREQVQVGNSPRGEMLEGLIRTASGPCRGTFELAHRDRAGQALCTHGPDPAPEGVDVRQRRGPDATLAASPSQTSDAAGALAKVGCYGTGSDGYRVHLIYARASNVADRYASFAASFAQWAADLDMIVNASAAETGGTRHVRFLTDSSCNPIVGRVTFSPTGDDNLSNTMSELRSQGYARSDRKYLVWVDANVYCGIAQVYWDDSANSTPGANLSNGNTGVAGEVARVDNGCWGFGGSVEAHELMHNLGGVQTSAPNATPSNHCRDESDRMCYADGPGVTMEARCPASHENRFDCNHDDYFHTSPPAGSYLATHWNTASSAFLARSAGGESPPASTTTAAPSSVEPGDAITVSATGAQPSVAYGLRMASSAPGCATGLRLGADVNSDAGGNIPVTTRIIPTTTTSGLRHLCFVRQADATQVTAPTSLTVV